VNKREKLAQKRQMQQDGYSVGAFEAVVLVLIGVGIFAMILATLAYAVSR
jgi:hypothetical protein